jgi:hypothetical protein
MADLVTFTELATWTQNDASEVAADPLAIEVLDKVSGLVRFLGGHDDWEIDGVGEAKVPYDARLVALMVAKRAYENPGQVVQSGSIGPIGGDRVLDVAAMLLDLSETERATLTKYNATGDPDQPTTGLWVMRTTVQEDASGDAVLYVGDNMQVNLGDEREWMIPMFSPGDPGDPALYPEG